MNAEQIKIHNKEMFRQALHVIINENREKEMKKIMANVKPLGPPGVIDDGAEKIPVTHTEVNVCSGPYPM